MIGRLPDSRALNSKNGIFADGERMLEFALIPGMEIRIGRVTLIAESPLFRGLQELLHRLIGWGDDSLIEIDVALRGIRNATLRKEPLILHAESGHVSIARLLHRHLFGMDRPFVVFDPRSSTAGPHHRRSIRAIYDNGMAALEAATDGTLVVRRSRLPGDFEQMLSALRDGKASALLVVAAPVLPRGLPLHLQIAVPPLDTRMHEIGQIIDAYAADALAEVGDSFTSEDREWVARQPNLSLAMIETATRRLIARRASDGDISRTAERIGRSQGATSVWFARRSELPASTELMEEGEGDDGEDDQAVEQGRLADVRSAD
jgi:hypothetical protein